MKRMLLLGGFTVLLPLGLTIAQPPAEPTADARYGTSSNSQTVDRVNIGGGYGYGDYGGGHASTAQEGMARGMADVIRARGQALVDVARAETENERARRAYLENRNFAVSSFVQNRAIRDEYRQNAFDVKKERLAAYIKTRELKPILNSEFYESTGEIHWPIGLMHPHDENGRKQIEALFAERAKNGSLSGAEYIRLNKLLNDWVYHVGSHEGDFPSSVITEAVRFLRRLEMMLKGDFQ